MPGPVTDLFNPAGTEFMRRLNDIILSPASFRDPVTRQVVATICETIPAMLAIFDRSLNYLYVNQHYIDSVHSSQASWEGKSVTDYLPPHLHEHVMPRLKRALNGEHVSYWLDLSPPGQMSKTILVDYRPFYSESGTPECFLMHGCDVTELRRAQERLSASQNLEMVGRLTGGIAHDFNNQLTVILAALGIMKVRGSPGNLDTIDMCEQAVANSSRLTSQLLSYAGRQALVPESVSVNELLSKFIYFARAAVADNVSIELEECKGDLVLHVDRVQFESCILNLVFNARDALPNGGTVKIRCEAAFRDGGHWVTAPLSNNPDTQADFVMVEVSDNGIGMSPETTARVFQPFFTTKGASQGGRGMGLSMVYGFVKQTGGDIEIMSSLGLGTSMRLFLPRAEFVERYQKEVVLNQPRLARRLSVLVVDDDPLVAQMFMGMLDSLGHIAQKCDNAQEALEILGQNQVDVVITDIMIRGSMNGLSLREAVIKEYPNTSVICISGYVEFKTSDTKMLDKGIVFLPKPVSIANLRSALQSLGGLSKDQAVP